MTIIQRNRSIIPACDVRSLEQFERVVKGTKDIHAVGGYKVGFTLALRFGLPRVVATVKEHTDKPVIYDHQKAGTDIPDTGAGFMDACKEAGVDAVIIFPQAGPVTQYEWTRAAQAVSLPVIIGGEMTHPGYLQGGLMDDKYKELFRELGFVRRLDGYLDYLAPQDIYEIATRMGVRDFVMPGNKPDQIRLYRSVVQEAGGKEPAIYSPGLITQGGDITEGARAAGERFHGIVGRGLVDLATDEAIHARALELTAKL